MFGTEKKTNMPSASEALAGRAQAIAPPATHFVNGHPMLPPYPADTAMAMFGMGCFWGAERRFWQFPGVYLTAVGYAAGITPNPTYREVCSGLTGHNEVVFVVYNVNDVTYLDLLKLFWQSHNPTQGMRQGNDVGTQYRSGIYFYNEEQQQLAQQSKQAYQQVLLENKHGMITTEIKAAAEFYFAEEYHQQYLAKNPGGYCGLGGTGVQYSD